ncbi:porin [Dyella sp. A6]|uniref:porin n=1 Tax=Dyella aluminiiresistens TaxID=3069105 RepID=UPI002E7A1B86|nr:porin [Dyella sp. A6]
MSRPLHNRVIRHGALVALVTCLWLGFAPRSQATQDSWQMAPYTLGQGLYFPQQGLRIGGYADLHYYDIQDQRATYSVRDISLFATKDLGTRWQLFGELDAGNTVDLSAGHATSSDSELDVERLYLDYHASQSVSFRFGKFLTPFGEWNLIHADPLTWTVSRPLTTSAAFARHAAGAMMYGTVPVHGNDLDYWVYGDDSTDLGVGQDQDRAYSAFGADGTVRNNFRRALGGRLLYHLLGDRLGIGMSVLDYELQQPRQHYRLAGLDFNWNGRWLDLTGEAIRRSGGTTGRSGDKGGFVELEVPLRQRLYLVGRYERYSSAVLEQTSTIRTLGLNYRPIPGIVLKLEHRSGNHNLELAPTGWLASVAVLF